MLENIKTRGWLVGTLATIVVFIALSALALPTLQTSLTFLPILCVSIFAGALAGFIVRKRAIRQTAKLHFASNRNIESLGPELAEFVQNVIPEEEPAFVSDEATVWDISLSTQDEIIGRCFDHYGVQLRAEDLKLPLSRLLPELKRRRTK